MNKSIQDDFPRTNPPLPAGSKKEAFDDRYIYIKGTRTLYIYSRCLHPSEPSPVGFSLRSTRKCRTCDSGSVVRTTPGVSQVRHRVRRKCDTITVASATLSLSQVRHHHCRTYDTLAGCRSSRKSPPDISPKSDPHRQQGGL